MGYLNLVARTATLGKSRGPVTASRPRRPCLRCTGTADGRPRGGPLCLAGLVVTWLASTVVHAVGP